MSAAETRHSLTAHTSWEQVSSIEVAGDVGHPQGLLPWDDGWLVTTVHPEPGRGEVLVVADDGSVVERLDVTDGERIHPGGVGATAGASGAVIAVAEYRPASTTTIVRITPGLELVEIGRLDDHLGAICELADGTFLAATWGSRDYLRLDAEGREVDRRPNPSHHVDHQDLTVFDDGTVAATGIGWVPQPGALAMLGGLAVLDVDRLAPVFDTPVHAWMPSGRVITYNGAHVEAGGALSITCIVDDGTASIARWESRPAS